MEWLHCLFVVCFFIVGSYAVDSLRFVVIGDVGGLPIEPYSTFIERSTAVEMGKIADIYKPEFIMELGDNFYFDGVANINDKRFQDTFESVFTAPSLQVPWYFIAGNHDHRGNVSAQIEYSKLSKRWNFPNYYYYLEFPISDGKKIAIVMIDTVQLCGNTDDVLMQQPKGPTNLNDANKQWTFIENTLNGSKADYLFVAGHFPIYSVAEHGPTECLLTTLLPKMDKYGVNGYFNGHDHNLQHLRTKSSNGNNIDYFVSGMANFIDPSLTHQDAVPPGSLLFHDANLLTKGGLLYAEVTAKNMTFTFIGSNGKELYSTYVLPRRV